MWTNCWARPESIVLAFRKTLNVFGLDAVQKTKKTEKNVNELSDPSVNRTFRTLSTIVEKPYILDLMPSKRP